MKRNNTPIGTCECLFKSCALIVPVFVYQQRAKEQWARRHAGKYYGRCPVHGKFEGQEYLLENVKWADAAPVEGQQQPEKTPTKPAAAPVTSPEPPPQKKSEPFGFL